MSPSVTAVAFPPSRLLLSVPFIGVSSVMTRVEKTVFISYRRANLPWALAVYQNLTQHGLDVFLDYTGIASGDLGAGTVRRSWRLAAP
jgi:hypothetical protein